MASPFELILKRIPLLDDDDHLPLNLFPPDIPTSGGGGAVGPIQNSVDWVFQGDAVLRTGNYFWSTPPMSSIQPLYLTMTVGSAGSLVGGTGSSTVVLRINGAILATLTNPLESQRASTHTFSVSTLPPGSLLSLDITEVPNSSPLKVGDIVVQLWWKPYA